MKLILIRHGESAKNVGLDVLSEDNNLTIKGVHQAIGVGKKLVEQKIDAIYMHPKPGEPDQDDILLAAMNMIYGGR